MIRIELRKPWFLALSATILVVVVATLMAPPWRIDALQELKERGMPIAYASMESGPDTHTEAASGMQSLKRVAIDFFTQDRSDVTAQRYLDDDALRAFLAGAVPSAEFADALAAYLERRAEIFEQADALTAFDPEPYVYDADSALYYNAYATVSITEPVNAMKIRALYAIQTGDAEEAFRSIDTLLSMATILRGEAKWGYQLTAGYVADTVIESLLRWLEATPLPPAHQARFETIMADLRDVLAGYPLARLKSNLPFHVQVILDPWALGESVEQEYALRWGTNSLKRAAGFEYYATLVLANSVLQSVAIAAMEPQDAIQPSNRWWSLVSSAGRGRTGSEGYYVATNFLQGRKADMRRDMQLDAIETVLAIARYGEATGQLPADLTVLVPAYLDALPLDLCELIEMNRYVISERTLQPLVYEREATGYVLHSRCPYTARSASESEVYGAGLLVADQYSLEIHVSS